MKGIKLGRGDRPILAGGATATPTLVPDFDGAYTIALVVDDGEFASAPDSVTVTAANMPPVLDPIGPLTVDLGSTLSLQLTAGDPNPGTALTFSASPLPLPANAGLDAATGEFTFTPDATQVGVFNLTFGVTDGLLSDSESVSITVVGAPVGGTTAISGRALDTNDFVLGITTPVVGATISLLDAPTITTVTGANGNFTLSGIPSGLQVLDINSNTAAPGPGGAVYAGFREQIDLIADVNNVVDRPFFLPRIEAESLTQVSETVDVTVTNTRLGVSLFVKAGNARNPDGTPFTGELSISEVPLALAPAALPDLLRPGLLVTIQPVGVTFAAPAPISFPNIDSLPALKWVELWSLDAASGAFAMVGYQRVSSDGSTVDTITGGVRAADWHTIVPAPPEIISDNSNNPEDVDPETEEPCGSEVSSGSSTCLNSGNLSERHSLVGYNAAGQRNSLQLVYNSTAADPRPIIKTDIGFALSSLVVIPDTVSARVTISGIDQGDTLFTGTAGLDSTVSEAMRVSVQFDAGGLETGIYPFQMTVMSNLAATSVGSRRVGQVRVNNERGSALGAGWTLAGLNRLHLPGPLLTNGSGAISRFRPVLGGFENPAIYPLSGSGRRPAYTDFNGDGVLDMAVPLLSNKIDIFLGNGNGAFSTQLQTDAFPGGLGLRAYASHGGDLNKDGIPDLVTVLNRISSTDQDKISVQLGNGDGTFQAPLLLDTYVDIRAVGAADAAIADFDNDGNQDIASLMESGRVRFFFGDGAGGFPADRWRTVHLGPGGSATEILAPDVNNDGSPDIVFDSSGVIAVSPNDGAAGFTRETTSFYEATDGFSFQPGILDMADLNSDTYLDVVFGDTQGDGISILLNDGAGGFLPRLVHPFGGSRTVRGVSVNDFDRDGVPDLAVGRSSPARLSIMTGLGDGNFNLPQDIDLSDRGFSSAGLKFLHTSDLNDDGWVDVISNAFIDGTSSMQVMLGIPAGSTSHISPPNDYSTLIRNPDGTFTRTLRNGTQIQFDADGFQTAVTDLIGRTKSYAYDTSNRIETITDAAGLVTTFNYVGEHIDNIVDPASRVTRFQHDSEGNLTKITDPDDSFRQFAYDPEHRLVSQTDKRGFSKTYEYDSFGRHARSTWPDGSERLITAVQTAGLPDTAGGFGSANSPAPAVRPTEAAGSFFDGNGNLEVRNTNRFGFTTSRTVAVGTPEERTITAERDDNNNVTRVVEPERTTTMTYFPNGLVKTRTVTDTTTHTVPYSTAGQSRTWTFTYNALNKVETVDGPRTDVSDVTTNEYDPVNGNLIRTTNALGHVSEITAYNAFGQPLHMIDANGVETTLTYYPQGWLKTSTVDSGTGGTPATTSFTYDGAGNMTGTILPDGSTLASEYDGVGRLTAIGNGAGERTEFTYDAAGNRTGTDVRAAGAPGDIVRTSGAVFDNLGRLHKSLGAFAGEETGFAYDSNGNRVSVTDPLANVTGSAFDALNRLVQVTDALLNTADYSYDAAGNRETATDQRGLVTSYVHNGFGEVIQRSSPDTGDTVFAYDSGGNRVSRTDARGVATDWTYDALGRVLTMVFPANPAENVTNGYDDPTAGQYGVGRLASVTDDSGSTSYRYDARGNTVRVGTVVGAQTYVTEYAYDLADRLVQMVYPGGRIVTQARDTIGRVTGVTTKANSGAPVAALASGGAYQAMGPLDALTWGNGVTLALAYDLDGRMEALDAFDGGTPILDLDYGFDLSGDITGITDTGGGPRGRTYVYDALHRLEDAGGSIPTETYTWDSVSNRTSRNIGGTLETYAYGAFSNQLDTVTVGATVRTLGYGPSGNTSSDDDGLGVVLTHLYDSTDRLSEVKQGVATLGAYVHNAAGQRVSKTVGGVTTHYLYDLGGNIIAEADGASGATAAEYVTLGGVPLAYIETATIYFVHADHLGTPQRITDGARAVVWDANYTPFGDTTITGSLTYNLRFPGQYSDAETGLNYNMFRDYDPSLGRYIESDPIGLSGGFNTYAYTAGNPVMFTDPTGRIILPQTVSLAAATIVCGEFAVDSMEAVFGTRKAQNNLADAFRHCVWQCCLTKAVGTFQANMVGVANEAILGPANPKCSKEMDLRNNRAGQRSASQPSCSDACLTAKLTVLANPTEPDGSEIPACNIDGLTAKVCEFRTQSAAGSI